MKERRKEATVLQTQKGLTGLLTDLLTYISRSLMLSFCVSMSLTVITSSSLYVFIVPYYHIRGSLLKATSLPYILDIQPFYMGVNLSLFTAYTSPYSLSAYPLQQYGINWEASDLILNSIQTQIPLSQIPRDDHESQLSKISMMDDCQTLSSIIVILCLVIFSFTFPHFS